MARPEKPIDRTAGPLAEFALDLRELRQRAGGIGYREMKALVNCSASALSEAASGNKFPTWEITREYVTACRGDREEWHQRWSAVSTAMNSHRTRPPARPDASARAAHSGPVTPAAQRQRGAPPAGAPGATARKPNPRNISDIAGLVKEMNRLRIWHGKPSLRTLAHQSGGKLPHTTLADTLNRDDKMPSLKLLVAFTEACGEPPHEVSKWKDAWRRIAYASS